MKIEVLDLARQEFDDAYTHYESQWRGLGEEFRVAVKVQVGKIKSHPDAWMLVRPASGGVSATASLTKSSTNASAMTC